MIAERASTGVERPITRRLLGSPFAMLFLIGKLTLRGVAQLGSALLWGSRGRRFKSCRSDQQNIC